MHLLRLATALVISAGALLAHEEDTHFKHFLNEEELLEANANLLRTRRHLPTDPLAASRAFSRVRRQMAGDGGVPYAYDEDNAEESGPWEEWSGSGECSRTCGGGVIVETRECGSPDASKCVGATKRFSSCNISPCPPGAR